MPLMPKRFVRVSSRPRRDPSIRGIDGRRKVARPDMRFVPVRTEDQRAVLMTQRTRDFRVRRQTQLGNAIRVHPGEFGLVVARGVHTIERRLTLADAATLAAPAHQSILLLAGQFRETHARIEAVTTAIKAEAQKDAVARRLQI